MEFIVTERQDKKCLFELISDVAKAIRKAMQHEDANNVDWTKLFQGKEVSLPYEGGVCM